MLPSSPRRTETRPCSWLGRKKREAERFVGPRMQEHVLGYKEQPRVVGGGAIVLRCGVCRSSYSRSWWESFLTVTTNANLEESHVFEKTVSVRLSPHGASRQKVQSWHFCTVRAFARGLVASELQNITIVAVVRLYNSQLQPTPLPNRSLYTILNTAVYCPHAVCDVPVRVEQRPPQPRESPRRSVALHLGAQLSQDGRHPGGRRAPCAAL